MSPRRTLYVAALLAWAAALAPACSSEETASPAACIVPTDPRRPGSCVSWEGERICTCAREQRFVVEADIVKDKTTGLTWQKRDSSDDGLGDNGNGGRVVWEEAVAYCAKLTLAGGGWRLPTVEEAKALVDEEESSGRCYAPCAFNSACADYWTSTKVGTAAGEQVYQMSQSNGGEDRADLSQDFHVRCVR